MPKKFRSVLSKATLLLAGSPMLIGSSLQLHAVGTPQTAALEQSSDAFLKGWLRQDVVYLVSDAEKVAYMNLASDPERYAFIERFWQQRDPSPGTSLNEFRDEHYRRIKYANARFSGTGEGWKTDRGRIYITLGPPDQIEAHPSGDGRSGPFEIWRYRAGPGLSERTLEFAGPDYKLQSH